MAEEHVRGRRGRRGRYKEGAKDAPKQLPPLSEAARKRAEAAELDAIPPAPDYAAAARIRDASPLAVAEVRDALVAEWLMLATQIRVVEWAQRRGERLTADECRSLSPMAKRHEEVLVLLGVTERKAKPSRLSALARGGES